MAAFGSEHTSAGRDIYDIIHAGSPAEFVDAEHISLGVTFACAMTRRETFETLGGLDETFLPNAYGDVEMCLSQCSGRLSQLLLRAASLAFITSRNRAGMQMRRLSSVVFMSDTVKLWPNGV